MLKDKIISFLKNYIEYTERCKTKFPNFWVGENDEILEILEEKIGYEVNDTCELQDELIKQLNAIINKLEKTKDKSLIKDMDNFLCGCNNMCKFLLKFKLLEE